MKYVVILEEVTIHRVEVESTDVDEAQDYAVKWWKEGLLCDDDPHLDQLNVLEVRTLKEDGSD